MSSVRSLTFLQVRRPASHSLRSSHLTRPIFSHLHLQHGRRGFHWQSAASVAIEGTQQLIVDLHAATHLPWFLTIPLVAFTVTAIFRLPFTVYTQRIMVRRAELGTITQAWNARIQDEVRDDGVPMSRAMSEVKRRQDKVLAKLYRKLGLQSWRLYGSFLSFPVWLITIDGVRRLCGGPRGLIGSMIAGAVEPTEAAAVKSAVDTVSADSAAVVSSVADNAWASILDPSLKFEGCLWFTDLTVSDPYHILPFALSATLVYNLMPATKQQFLDRMRVATGRQPQSERAQILSRDARVDWGERVRAVFHLTMIGLATMIGPATLDLPAALHLYWLASSTSNAVFAKILRLVMPVKGTLRKRCTGVEQAYIRPRKN